MFIYKNITYNREEYNDKVFYRTDDIKCAKNKLFSSVDGIHYYIDAYLKKINKVDKDAEYYQTQLAIYNYHQKHRTKFIKPVMNNYGVLFVCHVNNTKHQFYYSSRSFLDAKSKLEKYFAQNKEKPKKSNFQIEFLHSQRNNVVNNTINHKTAKSETKRSTSNIIKSNLQDSKSNNDSETLALRTQLQLKLEKIKRSNNISPINKAKRITAIKEELSKISS